jgi:hypothetical protein
VGDIDLKVIFGSENPNKFQKTRFWKEKSVENVVILEGLPFNSSMISFHMWLFKRIVRPKKNYENSNISPCKNVIFKTIL